MGSATVGLVTLVVSACLWKPSSSTGHFQRSQHLQQMGSISLCTDNPSSFENGTTIPAVLGKPVSVVFCVQCEPTRTITPYINIEHPNYPRKINDYYSNSRDESGPIKVKIVRDQNKAQINIMIKSVSMADLANKFSVKIHTSKGLSDHSFFFFSLDEATKPDPIASRTSPIVSTELTTLPGIWTTSLLIASSTASFPATTVPLIPMMSTEETQQSWPNKTSRCPDNWYQVDNDTCLLVIAVSNNTLPIHNCDKRGGEPVKNRNLNKFITSLKKLIDVSKEVFSNYVLRLNKMVYVDLLSGYNTASHGSYSVACTQKTFELPIVSKFSIQVSINGKYSPLDNNASYITTSRKYVDVIVTCEAVGNPKPDVLITDASQKKIRSGDQIRLTSCGDSHNFTCTGKNSRGSYQDIRVIQILSPIVLQQFTVMRKPRRSEIRSGDTVELACSVSGCIETINISRNGHLLDETATQTALLVHVIEEVNCSHMGTYTCLASSQSDLTVKKTADLEVKGCPVFLCDSEGTSPEMSAALGENVTVSLCLMSSEALKLVATEPRIFVTWARNPDTSFYWTTNITIYNVQETDYTKHTVTIGNSQGNLDYNFTVKSQGTAYQKSEQKAQENELEPNVLLITLPTICFIIVVFIIIAIIWHRVKGTRFFGSRADKLSGSGSGDVTGGEVLYANLKETSAGRFSEAIEGERGHKTDGLQCPVTEEATDLHDKESGRITTEDGLVYITVVSANKQVKGKPRRNQRTSKRDHNDEDDHVEYLTLDFEKTGKFTITDEEENKEEDSGEQNEREQ